MKYKIEFTDGTSATVISEQGPEEKGSFLVLGEQYFIASNVKTIGPDNHTALIKRITSALQKEALLDQILENWNSFFPTTESMKKICTYIGVIAAQGWTVADFLLEVEPQPELGEANWIFLQVQEEAARRLFEQEVEVRNPRTGKMDWTFRQITA